MLISEVINTLQETQKEKGDIHVWVNSCGIYNNDDEILNFNNGD